MKEMTALTKGAASSAATKRKRYKLQTIQKPNFPSQLDRIGNAGTADVSSYNSRQTGLG